MSSAMDDDRSLAERMVVIARIIDGRPELVFEAFTDVRHLSQWWGPDGFTTATQAFEFRVGGVWAFVMHGPDGTDYPNWITWREIVRPKQITLLHGETAVDPNAFESTLTFEAREGATAIVMRTVFPSKELRDQAVEQYGAIEGGKQTLAKLAQYVSGITRTEGAT